jgi:peptidoglycan L-alanyl-D-glutamate endopeptidase CwlK
MPSFGSTSKERLSTIDHRLRMACEEAIKLYDFTVLVGHRTEQEQNKAFAEAKSKLHWPKSKHNQLPSLAVDIAPYPIDWNDTKRFYYLAGLMKGCAAKLGYKLRWGGDWDGDGDFKDQSFNDLVHFEIIEG